MPDILSGLLPPLARSPDPVGAATTPPLNAPGISAPPISPRPAVNNIAPPLAPDRGMSPQAIHAGISQQINANSDRAFNQWYGSLKPQDLAQFGQQPSGDLPGLPTHVGFSLTRANGQHFQDNTPRTTAELSALQRQQAREHFQANVLPNDPVHQDLLMRRASLGLAQPAANVAPPLAPGRMPASPRPVAPVRPPAERAPSLVAQDQARTGLIQQQTANAVAATQPGGKDVPKPTATRPAAATKPAPVVTQATIDRQDGEAYKLALISFNQTRKDDPGTIAEFKAKRHPTTQPATSQPSTPAAGTQPAAANAAPHPNTTLPMPPYGMNPGANVMSPATHAKEWAAFKAAAGGDVKKAEAMALANGWK